MTTKSYQLLFILPVLVGCRQPLPCTDCGADDKANDDADEPDPDLPPPSDLPPCGDVDLLTDNENCGVCGHECTVREPLWRGGPGGVQRDHGTCQDGTCSPTWSWCLYTFQGETCNSLLGTFGLTCTTGCAAMGEDNLAAIMMVFVDELFPATCSYAASAGTFDETYPLDVGCDDPLPWQPFSIVWCCAEQLPPP
jgi:hypothetical protein